MAGITFARIVANCDILRLNLEPMLAENPHLAPEHAELVAFLTDAKALQARQGDLRGQKQETTRLRREAEIRGQDVFGRVAALLRGKLGFKNENLLKFGIPPRKRVRRPKQEGPAPPASGGSTPTPGGPTPLPQAANAKDGQPSEVAAES